MERVAAIDFFAVRTELLTQHRRASRGGDTAGIYADNHNDVTLKFGGAGDGEVQERYRARQWSFGAARAESGQVSKGGRAAPSAETRSERDRVPMRSRFSREVLVCRSWSQSVSRHGRARARRFAVGYLSRELIPREFVSINNSTVIA